MTAMIDLRGAIIQGGNGGVGIDGGLGGRGGDVYFNFTDPKTVLRKALNPVLGAGLIEDKACLPNTRVQTLEQITNWIENLTSSPVLFIIGGAGTGKSAIANAIGLHYKGKGQLGAFFCFDHSFQAVRGPDTLFRTIACNLADWNQDFGKLVADRIHTEGSNLNMTDMRAQLGLIIDTAKNFSSPVLLVVDALDESGSSEARQLLLYLLSEYSAKWPMNFRIIITSRPEADIIHTMSKISPPANCIDLGGIEAQQEATNNIGIYIHHQFKSANKHLSDEQYKVLVDKADGLFQWAFTACQWILVSKGSTVQQRFNSLLDPSGSHFGSLDLLYSSILKEEFDSEDPIVLKQFQSVMAQMLSASEPLSIESHNKLCHLPNGSSDSEIIAIMQHMASLLIGVTNHHDPVRPYHVSFQDFLTTESRSKEWYIDTSNGHPFMLNGCLDIMNRDLHFNIGNFKSSFLPNIEMIAKYNSTESMDQALEYACRFWTYHLGENLEDSLLPKVDLFMKEKLLFWLEALSICYAMNTAGTMLESLSKILLSKDNGKQGTSQNWLPKVFSILESPIMDTLVPSTAAEDLDNKRDYLKVLAEDAIKFVQYFGPAIAHSAPHIYISALSFAPKSSKLAKLYSSGLKNILELNVGKLSQWPIQRASLAGHTDFVYSVAFSSDGKHIISGSRDNTICIWDVKTGQAIGKPLEGHTNEVYSVACSPDGKHIVSGSKDCTIRIWDAKTGQIVGQPLEGHTGEVNSVAFSPDGKEIVSGSGKEIHIWDTKTGQAIGKPLKGHTEMVTSVVFSPDGRHILSSSYDWTIKIWDAKTGKTVGNPLKRVKHGATSIAFSPDGKQFVSGSVDGKIQIWDAKIRKPVGKVLEACNGTVRAVAFSPDGKHIVSGSSENIIQIWEVKTGWTAATPFKLEGHTNQIMSVAFSPDGKQIVSGSLDKTIRIWDTRINKTQTIEKPLKGHKDRVTSVAFSPDSRHIVSSSWDKTIQIWDAKTGQPVGKPLNKHTQFVKSAAWSPDGKQIVSCSDDDTFQILDIKTQKTVLKEHSMGATSIVFSPDGKQIASGSWKNTIHIWDAKTGQAVGKPLEGHTEKVNSVAFSPDGKHIVSGSQDNTVRIWDAKTGQTVGKPLTGYIYGASSVAISSNGKQVVSSFGFNKIKIWDMETGRTVGNPLEGHTNQVKSVAFSPDGHQIVSGSNDSTVRIWDTKTGQAVGKPLEGHTMEVTSVAFSSDGKQIVSGSLDQTIRIWDVETVLNSGKPLLKAQITSSGSHTKKQIDLINTQYLINQFSLDQDGWARGPGNELLFWVPSIHRPYFYVPAIIKIIGPYETILDFSHVAWGTNWTECFAS